MHTVIDHNINHDAKDLTTNYRFESEVLRILSRAKYDGFTLPDWRTKVAMNILIKQMKADGFWQKPDSILNLAYNNPALANFSMINWKNPWSITNLVNYSADWSNAGWTVSGVSVTKNINSGIAPDGSNTACLINDSDGSATCFKQNIVSNSTTITYSVYTKGVTSLITRHFLLRNQTTGTNFTLGSFNHNTGTFNIGDGWTSTSVGNGWYRLSYTQSTGISVGDNLIIYWGGTGGAGQAGQFLVWGAQVEDRNTASRYTKTTASPIYGNGLASVHGGMTYTTQGWEGNGIDGYVDLHYNPVQSGVNFLQNDCNITLVNYKIAGLPFYLTGYGSSTGGFRRITNLNSVGQNLNSGNMTNSVSMAGIGLKSIYRTNSTTLNMVNRGTLVTESTPATASPTNSSQLLLRNTTDYTNGGISVFLMGGSLTFDQTQNFRSYYNKFLTELGLTPTA